MHVAGQITIFYNSGDIFRLKTQTASTRLSSMKEIIEGNLRAALWEKLRHKVKAAEKCEYSMMVGTRSDVRSGYLSLLPFQELRGGW